VGEDNDSILREMLGLSDPEIAALYADQVLLRAPSAPEKASV